MRPRARHDELVVQEMEEETLIYDLEQHRAHCLNDVAARVWRLCDGTRDLAALARDAGTDTAVVGYALHRLGRARLLAEGPPRAALLGRRALLRRVGAAALPVVASIVAPTAAQAATCRLPQPISPAQCNAGNPNALGCCCSNNRTCVSVGGGGCQGPSC